MLHTNTHRQALDTADEQSTACSPAFSPPEPLGQLLLKLLPEEAYPQQAYPKQAYPQGAYSQGAYSQRLTVGVHDNDNNCPPWYLFFFVGGRGGGGDCGGSGVGGVVMCQYVLQEVGCHVYMCIDVHILYTHICTHIYTHRSAAAIEHADVLLTANDDMNTSNNKNSSNEYNGNTVYIPAHAWLLAARCPMLARHLANNSNNNNDNNDNNNTHGDIATDANHANTTTTITTTSIPAAYTHIHRTLAVPAPPPSPTSLTPISPPHPAPLMPASILIHMLHYMYCGHVDAPRTLLPQLRAAGVWLELDELVERIDVGLLEEGKWTSGVNGGVSGWAPHRCAAGAGEGGAGGEVVTVMPER